MRKSVIGIILLSIVIVGIALPMGFSAQEGGKVITYGETTYNNANYKSVVDNFFSQQAHVDPRNIQSKIITASDVNQISGSISQRTYGSDQIFSSALVDLDETGPIKVTVDKSQITVVTAEMYISALKSAGITHGHVYVTSPVPATGESALAGIMHAYEQATNVQIPETVQEAANQEIYTESQIVENDNITADQLTTMVNDVKVIVQNNNITDHSTIVNINISNSSIDNLATSIGQIQSVQGDVQSYSNQVNQVIGNTSGGFSLDGILSRFGL